jgi:hypothetical protein
MKTEAEVRAKLNELLSQDARTYPDPRLIYSKTATCKILLWALGENEDDRWFIRALPGPPVRTQFDDTPQ